VGYYNPELAESVTKTKIRAAIIKEPSNKFPKQIDPSPSPGQYDAHLTPFGAGNKNRMTIGPKYQFKPDDNPAVG
jgi:hypothetical protein